MHEVYETEYSEAHTRRYPAIIYCTFNDWGKMIGKVYRKNPNTTETLQSSLFFVQT